MKLSSFHKLILASLVIVILSGCAGQNNPAGAVEAYLQALVAKDTEKISSLACNQWEEQAQMELDSFAAVKTSLEGLSCQSAGKEGDNELVQCQGKIIASYNEENQELDLANNTYVVVKEGGEWRVCGYK